MTRKMLGDVGAGHFIALGRLACHDHDFNQLGASQNGIASAAARAALRLPSQHSMTRSRLRPVL